VRYTVIFPSGKVMCFYSKAVAELYASNHNGTMMTEAVLNDQMTEVCV